MEAVGDSRVGEMLLPRTVRQFDSQNLSDLW